MIFRQRFNCLESVTGIGAFGLEDDFIATADAQHCQFVETAGAGAFIAFDNDNVCRILC